MGNKLQASFGALYAALEIPRVGRSIVAVMLLIHTGLLAYSAYVHSPTLNEPGHLVAGLSYWRFGRVGEKYMPPIYYKTGLFYGDNEHMYAGFNNDVNRSAWRHPERDSATGQYDSVFAFGGPHPDSWNAAFADGSVHSINFDQYLEVHRRMGGRDDGDTLSKSGL